jgi:NAD-dependent aldehyde dehydrogenases
LVLNKHIKAVGFTGSLKAGRALYNLAATRAEPIPVFAEMGSINPVVILPEALDKRASTIAQTIATSITLGAGQFCTNPGIIIAVKSKGLTTFINALSKEIVNVAPACMLHPNISAAYTTNKQKAIDQKGMSVLSEYVADASVNFAKQTLATVDASLFLKNTTLQQEVFGPYSLVVQCANIQELETVVNALEGQLTGTIIAEDKEIENYNTIINALKHKVGRLIFNGVPTGVEVCQSMLHGGPYPATTDSRFTAVGVDAIKRFVRPVSYQSWPDAMLPKALQNKNPLKLLRTVNGVKTTKEISL